MVHENIVLSFHHKYSVGLTFKMYQIHSRQGFCAARIPLKDQDSPNPIIGGYPIPSDLPHSLPR